MKRRAHLDAIGPLRVAPDADADLSGEFPVRNIDVVRFEALGLAADRRQVDDGNPNARPAAIDPRELDGGVDAALGLRPAPDHQQPTEQQ